MFELYVFDVTKIKDSDITDGSWVRAIVIALKMQGNSVSERWSPKRGTGAYYIYMTSSRASNRYFVPGPTKFFGGPDPSDYRRYSVNDRRDCSDYMETRL